jgi:hypothetical protein
MNSLSESKQVNVANICNVIPWGAVSILMVDRANVALIKGLTYRPDSAGNVGNVINVDFKARKRIDIKE